jgi:hypothetical protein
MLCNSRLCLELIKHGKIPTKQVCLLQAHTKKTERETETEPNLCTSNVNLVINSYLHFAATNICKLFIPTFMAMFYTCISI